MPDHKLHPSRREIILQEQSVNTLGVAIYNVVDLLPRLTAKPPSKRKAENIKYVTIHHSGAEGRGGFQGLLDCTQFCIRPEPQGRGFRSMAYHFWIPRDNDAIDGNRVIYRCLFDNEIGSNCKGINSVNVGVAMQGNTSEVPISENHQTCMSALIPYLVERYSIKDPLGVFGHFEAGKFGGHQKPTCPGTAGTKFMLAQREEFKKITHMFA